VRVLLTSTQGAGHFLPLVPFGQAAQRRGDEVLAAGPPSLAANARDAGFDFWPVETPSERRLQKVWSRVPRLAPEDLNAFVVREVFARATTTASLPRLQEAGERWRPDLVLHEATEFGGALLAEQLGIPQAHVAITLTAADEEATYQAAPAVDDLRRSLGLPADPDGARIRAAPCLTMVPAGFEDLAGTGPRWIIRVRDPGWGTAPAGEPAWRDPALGPLVYVTFGSAAGGMARAGTIYALAVAAVAQLPIQVLLTVGREFNIRSLGRVPANVRVERWVPQAEVLAHASAIVCHGGSGTVLGALAAGVPLVVVPMFADQPRNAERIAAVGAGVVVAPPDPGAIRSAIQAVLAEPRYLGVAQRLRAEMLAMPAADEALAQAFAYERPE
jgi:UDP:flavonoid glycosyltransferase YjiC (YdhE family)